MVQLNLLLLSRSVMSDSLWPHGLQHTRLPCPSPPSWGSKDGDGFWCHLILCGPLLLRPSILLSIKVFSKESALCIRWPKYWSFNFSISLSNEYSGLISFRTDSFGLLAVQWTLKSLLQHHSSKASTIQCSAFFMTTGKTYAFILNNLII